MAVEYCNITTDLYDVFAQIDDYRGMRRLTGWQATQNDIYVLKRSGYYEMLFRDGDELTPATSELLIDGDFYYHADSDTLYLRLPDSSDPANSKIEGGPDWDNLKLRMRNDAQEELEALLSSHFVIPFQKIVDPGESYNSREYDEGIRRAAAILTVVRLIRRIDPDSEIATTLYKQVNHNRFAPNEEGQFGWVQRVLRGDVNLKIQRTSRQTGGYDVIEGDGNSGTGGLLITGRYTGSDKQVWRVEIDTAGPAGTATYRLSYNDGADWVEELSETRESNSSNRRVWLANGIFAEFVGDFSVGDYWRIVLYPSTDEGNIRKVKSVRLER